MAGRKRKEGHSGFLLFPLMAAWMLRQLTPYHWGDLLIEEESGFRLFLLKRYAWLEVRLLAFFYWLLRRPFMSNPWINKFFYYTMAKFAGEHMVVSQVMTREEMLEFIASMPEENRIAVGPCRCRLATHACDHPLETDIVIMTGTQIWLDLFPKDYRIISKEEAQEIVKDCYEIALVPMLDRHMYYRGSANYFVICNCCGCSCLPIWAYRTYKDAGYHFIPSVYRSTVDLDKCEGCATCVEVCAFDERMLNGGKAQVFDCQGCGLCVKFCPNQANSMLPR
jgi:NAD-dependent dihydropyrimidine dehydrogenase PreA subunit